MKVSLDDCGAILDGKQLPLFSASFQYWRSKRQDWEKILDLAASLGFRIIETYVPWSAHEIESGRFDFGESDRNLDLPGFIELAGKKDMKLIVRPGPHINAEMTLFGYPERVLRDEQCLSRSVDGDPVWIPIPPKMWPAPSYASKKFYEQVAGWFDGLAPILKPALHPEGPIIAVQLDNEFCNMFRNSPYDHDYHPEAIELWKDFYRDKRGAEAPEPPRAFLARDKSDLSLYLDWVEFKERYMSLAIRRLRSMWEERGIRDVLFTSNYPVPGDSPPLDWSGLEKIVDIHGPDMYPTRRQYKGLKKLCLHAAGTSRLPMIPEFSSGSFFWSAPLSVRDQQFTTWVTIMHGIKAINFYMIVERERWYGSPIARDGRKREKQWDFFEGFMKSLLDHDEYYKGQKIAPALLLSARDYERLLQASSILDPAPPLAIGVPPARTHASADTLGFSTAIQQQYEKRLGALFSLLTLGRVGFNCGNTSQELEDLSSYKLVALPTYDFLGKGAQEKLAAYMRQGGALLIGPSIPALDEDMQACSILKDAIGEGQELAPGVTVHQAGEGRAVVISGDLPGSRDEQARRQAADMMAAIADELGIYRPFIPEDLAIDLAIHKHEGAATLFLANPTRDGRVARMTGVGRLTFICHATGDSHTPDQSGTVEIPVPAYSVLRLAINGGLPQGI